jgi:hypothetical protein
VKRIIDRRAVIFFFFAGVCLLLAPLAPAEFRWVGETLALVYAILGGMSWLDFVTYRRTRKK